MPEPDSPPIPTKLEDQLEVLDTFVESADELAGSTYIKQLQANGLSVIRQWTPNSLTVTTTSPDHEAAKAVVLTLRMFCQNNDATSLGNIASMLANMTADPTALSNFQKSRDNFNAYLNSSPSITFPSDAKANTRRQIWDTFLYGMFAHARIGKRRTIKNWQSQPYADDVRMQFDLIILEFIKAVTIMAKACKTIADSNRSLAS
ncbi:MAG: hypothetical protein R3C20_12420 [Planctomycetaceae bacterium]